jgi:cytoskeletal protein RodZ
MIVLHAVKWKTAESGHERDEAKKGIINVVLGLALISLAGAIVMTLFVNPESVRWKNTTKTTTLYTPTTSGGGSTSSTSSASSTSSTSTTFSGTTTTTPLISKAECYNAENGNLCNGLDFTYGAGTRTLCCSAHGCCCSPITPGTCKP